MKHRPERSTARLRLRRERSVERSPKSERSRRRLDQEYAPNAATQARAADRVRLARQRQQAEARAADQRRSAALEARERAAPIMDEDELAESVAELAGAWGLKRKQVRRR